ncbi:MAG TPA: PP2C family serine/threonine-protein phosphatase [Verrucomicrobiae bacterium]|jgi:protein phosphatase|nr:PP2C family serine/threonine-protein phosphatase [Verrucomicrobiae bacterium]
MKSPTPANPATSLKWFGWTDRGKVRANNEDAFLGLQFDARETHRLGKVGEAAVQNHDYVFAVSDGMGGALAGEYASKIAVDKITTLLPKAFRHSALGMEAGFSDLLTELFTETHRALAYLGSSYEECAGMEATLTLGWFTPLWLYFGHIGDSRLYYLPAATGQIRQVTHDDTHVGWLFRNGQINEREARTHPRRNVLQKALGGANQFVDPQVGAIGCEAGDVFLICSDGLIDGLYDHQIADLIKPSRRRKKEINPAQQLVQAALETGGRDNITALVIQVH